MVMESTRPLSIEKPRAVANLRERERWTSQDIVFSFVALALCLLLTQTIWALVIRPNADAILNAPQRITNADKADHAVRQLRSPYVILRDYEQQVSITLGLWALVILARQWRGTTQARRLLERNYVNVGEGMVVLPEDVRIYSRSLEGLPEHEQELFLPRLLTVALNRFGATGRIQDAAEAVRDECEFESSSQEAKLSMVRFTAWAIPAVGFVGTVRGIGAALQEAQGAMGGDISGVTLGLGVTFNSTLTALIMTIIVMFWIHQLQQAQDRLVLDSRTYVDRRLLRQMREGR